VQNGTDGEGGVRAVLDRVLASYEDIDRRFAASGGMEALLALWDRLRVELDRIGYDELDRMSQEIRGLVEALLKMDYDLRTVHALKRALDARAAGLAPGS
jgi:hypothetical protein